MSSRRSRSSAFQNEANNLHIQHARGKVKAVKMARKDGLAQLPAMYREAVVPIASGHLNFVGIPYSYRTVPQVAMELQPS